MPSKLVLIPFEQNKKHSEQRYIPDYSNVYGITDSNSSQSQITQTTAYQPGSTAGTLTYSDAGHYRHYVLQLQLTSKHIVYLINLDGVGYLPSNDVSSFFWDTDILGSMIQRSDLDIQCVKVSPLEQPALFDELQKYRDKRQEADLKLYEINSLPIILEEFGSESLPYGAELNSNIIQLIETFDPEDPYWKGEVSIEQSDEAPGDQLEDLPAADMQLMLQTMQIRRKRILQLMLSGETSDKHVDDLQSIDKMIEKLKDRIKEVQKSQEEPSETKPEMKAERFEDAESTSVATNIATVSPTKQKPIATVASMQSTNVGAPLPSTQTQFTNNQSAFNPASLLGMNLNQSDSSNMFGLNQSGLLLDPTNIMNVSQTPMTSETAASNTLNLSQMNLAYQNLLLSQAVLASQSTTPSNTNSGLNPDLLNLMQASLMNPLLAQGLTGSMSGMGDVNPQPQGLGRGQNLRMASPLNVRMPTPPPESTQNTAGCIPDMIQGAQNTSATANPNNLGILPGLMPLFQRMTLGGTTMNNDQKPKNNN
ncbi:hypothetical protein FSP39_025245 [Pinctada imbricata]|uniref:Uncharacterized protein n=1 Tax=Pinctada imbricata TaxID=66713 RepID=A0AA89BPB6_PINIB|nr:hypothetical protein FSP39_025245 [Pinctada imbricata]